MTLIFVLLQRKKKTYGFIIKLYDFKNAEIFLVVNISSDKDIMRSTLLGLIC